MSENIDIELLAGCGSRTVKDNRQSISMMMEGLDGIKEPTTIMIKTIEQLLTVTTPYFFLRWVLYARSYTEPPTQFQEHLELLPPRCVSTYAMGHWWMRLRFKSVYPFAIFVRRNSSAWCLQGILLLNWRIWSRSEQIYAHRWPCIKPSRSFVKKS